MFHLSIVAVFELASQKSVAFDQTFLENEELAKQQREQPQNFLSSKIKKRNDMESISQAFQDQRVPSSYDKGKQSYNKNIFDNLLDEEYEMAWQTRPAPSFKEPSIKNDSKQNLNT